MIPTALGRGAQVFARALVDELGGTDAGHTLVSLFDGESGVRVDRSLALPGGVAAASGLHPPAVARLVRILRDHRPDLVLAHGGDAFKYTALATRVPIAYCVIGTWPRAARHNAQSLLWRALIRRAWVSAAVSDDVAADLHQVLAVPDERIIVIPNGRDAQRYRPADQTREDDEVSLLFVGAFTEGKRPERFIQLVRRLRHEGSAVRATMVGDGPLHAALERDAMSEGIELAGFRKDVVPFLQGSDVFVFPSAPDGEGMPGVLIEAGLCGLPSVATRVAGASTVLEDGQTGALVDIDDADALASAVSGLVQDQRRRRSMGYAARRTMHGALCPARGCRSLGRALHPHDRGPGHAPTPVGRTRPDAGRLMCGIAGLLDTRQGTAADALHALAQDMASTLVHRGPDDAGTWVDAESGVGLGHRRLEVVGRGSQGQQPMVSPSTRWVVSYNGELYNTPALRAELGGAGLTIRGTSDTEVLVGAFDHWGLEATLERIEGMFAFAAWDRRERRLHLARDRFGEKPLYYGWAGARLRVRFGAQGLSHSADVRGPGRPRRRGELSPPQLRPRTNLHLSGPRKTESGNPGVRRGGFGSGPPARAGGVLVGRRRHRRRLPTASPPRRR